MDAPAISVIIPVYNVEKYITRCIQSVINQTFRNFEVILVDDCSPCQSLRVGLSILEEKKCNSFKVVKRSVNGGLGAARNSGIQVARGQYLFFLDSDDWLVNDALETLYETAMKNGAEIVAADFFISYEKYAYPASIFANVTDITSKKSFLLNYNPAAWNKLYMSYLFTANNIYFPEEKQWYEDVATIPLVIAKSNNIQIISRPIIYYYQRSDSIMGMTKQGNRKLFDIFNSLDRLVTNRRFFSRQEWIELEDNLAFHAGAARLDDIINIKSLKKRYDYISYLYGIIRKKLPRWNTSFPLNEHQNNYAGRTRFFIKKTFRSFIKGKIMCSLFWSLFVKKETDTRQKILISIPTLHMGGAEKVLINMLRLLDYNIYNVTLYIFEEIGVLEKDIPVQHVKLIKRTASRKNLYGQPFIGTILNSKISVKDRLLKIKMTLCKNLLGAEVSFRQYVARHDALPYNKYDIAISYTDLTPDMAEFILKHVRASKKIIWIHNDFNPFFIDYIDDAAFEKMFASFDAIVAVSSGALKSFAGRFNTLSGKLKVINNIIDTESVKRKAFEKVDDVYFDPSCINLISVGRVDLHVKGFDRVVSLSQQLVYEGFRFRWYIIGDGKDFEALKSNIAEESLCDTVILLGARENPYKYISACNALVVTSRFEAYPTVVIEAHTLRVPCIVARNAGCTDQFRNITPYIVAENNELDLLKQLRLFLSDNRLRMEMKDSLRHYHYDNDAILQKIDELFELKKISSVEDNHYSILDAEDSPKIGNNTTKTTVPVS